MYVVHKYFTKAVSISSPSVHPVIMEPVRVDLLCRAAASMLAAPEASCWKARDSAEAGAEQRAALGPQYRLSPSCATRVRSQFHLSQTAQIRFANPTMS